MQLTHQHATVLLTMSSAEQPSVREIKPPENLYDLNFEQLQSFTNGNDRDAFLDSWEKAAREATPVGTGSFDTEKVESICVYPAEYRVKDIYEQHAIFNGLDLINSKRDPNQSFGIDELQDEYELHPNWSMTAFLPDR